jgi:hypothetical protein
MNAVSSVMLSIEIWMWALVLRVLKHFVPLERLVILMHRRPRKGARPSARIAQLEEFVQRRARFPFRAPSNCLERNLAIYRVLCRSGASPELVVGFRTADGKLEGHVWLTVDGRAIAESAVELARYTTVFAFDAEGRRRSGGSSIETLSAADFM